MDDIARILRAVPVPEQATGKSRWAIAHHKFPEARIFPDLLDSGFDLVRRSYPDLPESERLLRSGIAFATLTQVLPQVPTGTSEAGLARRDRRVR